jgi:glycosyltransferase involved in cell wall biosynthesis
MRILLAVNNPSAHLFPLPNGWADRGHDVDILMDCPTGRFGHAREFIHSGVRQFALGPHSAVLDAVTEERTSASLSDLLEPADAVVVGGYSTRVARRILHTRTPSRARTVLLAERPFPRPQGPRRWLRDAWARSAVGRVDAVWSMSQAGDLAFERLGKTPEARIPYPISVPPVDVTSSPAAKWQPEVEYRLMILGQLIERKRPLAAVQVVRILLDHGTCVQAEFAGAGTLTEAVRNAAEGLPLTLHGHVPPSIVDAMLARSHLLLHPASHDGWGYAVVEAAIRGVPVVATTGCDAATELAVRTEGVRVTDGSPKAMAKAAQELLDAFRSDSTARTGELVRAVEEVCGVDRIVARSLDALTAGGENCG